MFKLLFIAAFAAVLFAAVSATVSEQDADNLFRLWKGRHGKEYSSPAEHEYRKRVFRANHEFIVKHNQEGHSFKVGHNQFSDLTNEEYRKMYLSPLNGDSPFGSNAVAHEYKGEALPTSVDWVKAGKVNPVKNQGQCGSCWAFSATGSIESAWAISKNQLVSLAEQQLVDCAGGKWGNDGCNGGLMNQAFEYIIANGGQDTESTYPYTAADGTCKFKAANVGAKITKYANVTANSNQALMSALTQGPVSIAIYAAGMSFQFYESGVYADKSCKEDVADLDHGVIVVGYGVADNGKLYWLVRNSWGASWGAQGYIYFARGSGASDQNTCGILDIPSYPIV